MTWSDVDLDASAVEEEWKIYFGRKIANPHAAAALEAAAVAKASE
ncbi:MAG TPA: hypothetical protein VFR35_07955 [Actinoplanes sp.]|nr:hypothetical protein [Actinoplanes sp.]